MAFVVKINCWLRSVLSVAYGKTVILFAVVAVTGCVGRTGVAPPEGTPPAPPVVSSPSCGMSPAADPRIRVSKEAMTPCKARPPWLPPKGKIDDDVYQMAINKGFEDLLICADRLEKLQDEVRYSFGVLRNDY